MYSNFNFQILEKSGFFLIHHNAITNSSRASQQPLNGLSMASQWPLNGLSIASQWPLNGLSMASQWPLDGLSMASQQPLNSLFYSLFYSLSVASQQPFLQPLGSLSIFIIKILRLIEQFLRHWNIIIFSFFNLSTSLDLFCNF